MTTEEDFQKALDANPEDHLTRLVFADWLQDRDDPRAEGYRALGSLCRLPRHSISVGFAACPYWISGEYDGKGFEKHQLEIDWFDALDVKGKDGYCAPYWSLDTSATRRILEDAAALAFARLSIERRQLLRKVAVPT